CFPSERHIASRRRCAQHIRYKICVLPMPVPPRYLATRLTEALPTTDGGTLRTIGDAVRYMTALPKHREMTKAWQHAAKLIIAREPVEVVTRQLSLALFTDAKLDLGHKRARAKTPA